MQSANYNCYHIKLNPTRYSPSAHRRLVTLAFSAPYKCTYLLTHLYNKMINDYAAVKVTTITALSRARTSTKAADAAKLLLLNTRVNISS